MRACGLLQVWVKQNKRRAKFKSLLKFHSRAVKFCEFLTRVKFKIYLSGFFGSLRYKILAAAHFAACGAENCSGGKPKAHRRAINLKDGS